MRAIITLVAFSAIACGGSATTRETQAPPGDARQATATSATVPSDPSSPPAVLTGNAHLDCTISNKENGKQTLSLMSGQGLEFDVVVSPIIDGVVQAKGPEKGGSYRFTSHLAKPGKGTLSGVGPVDIDAIDTKVNVAMNRYKQPGGPGTELTFTSDDMAMRGVYVEFAGKAHASNGDKYAFKVTLGAATTGSGGTVKPATDADTSPIVSKAVMIVAPQTTVVTTTTIQKLP